MYLNIVSPIPHWSRPPPHPWGHLRFREHRASLAFLHCRLAPHVPAGEVPGRIAARARGQPAHHGSFRRLRAPRSTSHPSAGLGARVALPPRPGGCRCGYPL
eukprot:3143342-Pleurochrysis_carterae.AAC.1